MNPSPVDRPPAVITWMYFHRRQRYAANRRLLDGYGYTEVIGFL
jgi:hypothetical protein